MDFNTNTKHGVIYADPPWTFKTYSDKGKDKSPEEPHGNRGASKSCSSEEEPANQADIRKCASEMKLWHTDDHTHEKGGTAPKGSGPFGDETSYRSYKGATRLCTANVSGPWNHMEWLLEKT